MISSAVGASNLTSLPPRPYFASANRSSTLTWDFVWEVSEAAMAQDAEGNFLINGQKVRCRPTGPVRSSADGRDQTAEWAKQRSLCVTPRVSSLSRRSNPSEEGKPSTKPMHESSRLLIWYFPDPQNRLRSRRRQARVPIP